MTEADTTKPSFDWFKPTVDDSKPMTWNEYVKLHMNGRDDKTISPKVQMQALSDRWRKRSAELKIKGRQTRARLLPVSEGHEGQSEARPTKHKVEKVKGFLSDKAVQKEKLRQRIKMAKLLKQAVFESDSDSDQDDAELHQKKRKKHKSSAVVASSDADDEEETQLLHSSGHESLPHSSRGGRSAHVQDYVRSIMNRQREDKSHVTKYRIPATKKNGRVFTQCLTEGLQDVKEGKLTAADAFLLGARIPFDYLASS